MEDHMSGLGCPMLLLNQADFDGELDVAHAAEVEAHRAGCPICQAAYADMQALRIMTREEGLGLRAPAQMLATFERKHAPRPATANSNNRHGWRRGGYGFAIGAAAAALILSVTLRTAPQPLLDQALDDHLRSLQPGHLEDVVSTDRHTVKPWFDGKIDFAPPVKDLAAHEFPLVGGRLDYLGGRQAAALVYTRGKHVINLFIQPTKDGTEAPAATVRDGYNLVHWMEGGMAAWAVSDLERDQLEEFVSLWRAAP